MLSANDKQTEQDGFLMLPAIEQIAINICCIYISTGKED